MMLQVDVAFKEFLEFSRKIHRYIDPSNSTSSGFLGFPRLYNIIILLFGILPLS